VFEIGNSLREARLRRQLDFRQIEQSTKIRSRYLRALEDEDFEVLPAETYVRGFLRSYADFLGLEGQLYVDEYNSRFVTGEEAGPMRPRRSGAMPRPGRGLETNVILVALTAIAVMTALVIAAWKFSAGSTTATPNQVVPKPACCGPAVKPRLTPSARAARPTKANVFVRAVRGDCWLEVHAGSASGRLLYQGTLERGQTQRFVARTLWMNAGVPGNLSVRLNGDEVPIGKNSPVVVVITPNSVTPAPLQS
jgi:cytoskeleton protein RodZ